MRNWTFLSSALSHILLCSLLCSGPSLVHADNVAKETAKEATKDALKDTSAEAKKTPSENDNLPKYNSFQEAFDAGVLAYQNKNFASAKSAFSSALNFQPENITVLTNLALTHFQLKDIGWSIALLRRSLATDPDFVTAQSALGFIYPQLEIKELPHVITSWEMWRTKVLISVSLPFLLGLLALFTLATVWIYLGWWSNKQIAEKNEQAPPPFTLVMVLLGAIWFITTVTTATKVMDLAIPRATIVASKVAVRTLPSEDSPMLFELTSGLEVVLETEKSDWWQVTYPGGMTGWIPKSALYKTSGGGH